MINSIIFDIGNVLLDFKPMDYLNRIIVDENNVLKLYKYIFQSDEWLELDRGTLTQEEFVQILCDRHPEHEISIKMCMDGWMGILTPKEDTIRVLQKIDFNKYKVLLLSNFHLLAFDYITKKYDFFNKFHGGIISYREKLIKPDDKIYQCIVDRYNISPELTVFIDDTDANVRAAKRLGFNTIHFESAEQMQEELEKYNIIDKN